MRPLLTPVAYDKLGPKFSESSVYTLALRMILTEQYFFKMAKNMNDDALKAIKLTEEVSVHFANTVKGLVKTANEISTCSRTAAGSVRDAAEKLGSGLAKLEKVANFDRLERYVDLLERAAKAMELLANLEQSGKLEKIAGALR